MSVASSLSVKIEEVVARDGIEPPTPAFSGPRSTTELSGLGLKITHAGLPRAPVRSSFLAESPAWCGEGLGHALSFAAFGNVDLQYSNPRPSRQTATSRGMLTEIVAK